MSLQLMIDLETLSTAPNAAILTIGACVFEMNKPDAEITETFEARISIESNERVGRDISGSTVAWWLQQSKAAQEALFKEPIVSLRNAITSLNLWIGQLPHIPTHIWAKDPDFDVVILRSAYEDVGQKWPLKYWANRSVRTIEELAYPEGDLPNFRTGVHHSALDDAVTQAISVRHCYNRIVHGITAAS